jgi:hypothetical protein
MLDGMLADLRVAEARVVYHRLRREGATDTVEFARHRRLARELDAQVARRCDDICGEARRVAGLLTGTFGDAVGDGPRGDAGVD